MKPRDRLPDTIRRARALRSPRRTPPAPQPMPDVTEETLRAALVYLAQIVTEHGQQYVPLFDVIEAELEKYKRARDPMSRARQVLAENAIDITPAPASAGGHSHG